MLRILWDEGFLYVFKCFEAFFGSGSGVSVADEKHGDKGSCYKKDCIREEDGHPQAVH